MSSSVRCFFLGCSLNDFALGFFHTSVRSRKHFFNLFYVHYISISLIFSYLFFMYKYFLHQASEPCSLYSCKNYILKINLFMKSSLTVKNLLKFKLTLTIVLLNSLSEQ